MTRHVAAPDTTLSALPVVWGAQSWTFCPVGEVLRRPQTGHIPLFQLQNGLLNPSTGQRSIMQVSEKLC